MARRSAGGLDYSNATEINDSGQVVGFSETESDRERAFLWDAVNALQDLKDLLDPGLIALFTRAVAINASGQIVGRGYFDGMEQGFLLTAIPDGSIPASLAQMLGSIGALAAAGRRKGRAGH
jgi:probable HAF family extracellular repeat protein